MKTAKSLLAIACIGLALLASGGCSGRPVTASQAYAAADDLDPVNKVAATDPRNKMAAHGIR